MMEHGVLFEVNGIRKHSAIDWGLHLAPFEIVPPTPKTSYVDIEGGDGSIDLTEVYGRIFYENREYSIEFSCDDRLRYTEKLNEIIAFLHGKEAKITFYFDADYYQMGRLTFNKYTSSAAMGSITLDVTAEPYKYHQQETITTSTIATKTIVNYVNDRMDVVPEFKASAAMNFKFNGNSYALSTSATRFPNVVFKQGDNLIEYEGNGTVQVRYLEGAL